MAPFAGGQRAPFAGGRVAPGSLVPVVGSFFSTPFVFYDQDLEYVGATSARVTLAFDHTTSELYTQISGGSVTIFPITTLPVQYRIEAPVQTNTSSFRRTKDFGPDALTNNPAGLGPGVLGVWFNSVTIRQWRLNRPAAGTVENTSTYECALTADESTVLARATVTLRYIRV